MANWRPDREGQVTWDETFYKTSDFPELNRKRVVKR